MHILVHCQIVARAIEINNNLLTKKAKTNKTKKNRSFLLSKHIDFQKWGLPIPALKLMSHTKLVIKRILQCDLALFHYYLSIYTNILTYKDKITYKLRDITFSRSWN